MRWFYISPLFLTPEVTIIAYLLTNLLNCSLHEVVQPLILIRKSKLRGVIILKYSILSTESCLKFCGQVEEEVLPFLLFVTEEYIKRTSCFIQIRKKAFLLVYLQKQKFKTSATNKFRCNLYRIHLWISMQYWHVHIYSFCTF